jgi:hypothetical protein
MHARNRTWLLGSDPVERCRQRTMNVEGGDGSTLSLDFTTGVLDPRLTFTRTTNATFINSQGYVQYADANLVLNSTMLVSDAWTATTSGGSPAVTINNDNTVTFASTAGRATWLQSITIQSGLPVTFSIELTALTNTNIRVSDLFQAGTGFTSQVYNYTDLSGNTTTNIGAFTTLPGVGLYTVNATTTAISGNVIFGTDCNGVTRTGSVTIARPQLQYGTRVNSRVYLANSSTSFANTNTPRFDYDPTTLTPRGLLIEGSANNLFFWSESFATSGAASNWAYNSNTGTIVTSTNPANGTTSFQFAETANSGPLQQSATVTNAVHTFSAWFKASVYNSVTTTQVQFGLYTTGFVAGTASIISGPGSTSVAGDVVTLSGLSETQWTRVQFTTSAAISSGSVAILIYPQTTGFEVNRSFYIWGAQLETGVGASSYIPTGASTGNRAADDCLLDNISTAFGFNAAEGTILVRYGNRVNSGSMRAYTFLPASGANNQIFESSGVALNAYSSGSFTAQIGSTSATGARICAAYKLNDYAVSVNGGAVATDTSGAVPSSLTRLSIGGSAVNSAAYNYGPISLFKYWPTRLPDAQLQALTT